MKPTRIALVGAGRIAHVHADAYLAMPDAQIVAVADTDLARAEGLAKRAGAKASVSYEDVVRDPDVDAVDICTPTATHKEIVLAALKAGKHVCCQKPFALSIDDCDEMIAAAKAADRILLVPYMSRHAPLTAKVKQLIDDGVIGDPISAHYHMLCPPYVALTPWFHDESMSGGILVDTLTHGVDMLNWYFGPVARVGAFRTSSGHRPPNSELVFANDNVAMIAQYNRGTVATLRTSWATTPTYPMLMLDIVGTKGTIKLDSPSAAVSYQRLELFGTDGTQVWENAGRGHAEKQRYFVDVVSGREKHRLSTPVDARSALAVTLAGWKAAKTGTIVAL